jgi:hypothetical protein
MLQIGPQMRILVAIEAVDSKKGDRRAGRVMPGETIDRSVFRLSVYI